MERNIDRLEKKTPSVKDLRALFVNESYGHVPLALCAVVEGDEVAMDLWNQTYEDIGNRGSRAPENDAFFLERLCKGPILEAWVNSSDEELRKQEQVYRVSSSVVRPIFENAKRSKDLTDKTRLTDLVSCMRMMIYARRFNLAAKAILHEREKRMRQKYALEPHQAITSMHRIDSPYFGSITLEQIAAYIRGDRSEALFSIENPNAPQQITAERTLGAAAVRGAMES